jgi:hypothetical protein
VSEPISVRLDVLRGLADDVSGLGADLAADEELCGALTGALWAGVEGVPGYRAAAAGAGWAGVLGVLARRSAAVADTLRAAGEEYRWAEEQLAEVLDVLLGRGHR